MIDHKQSDAHRYKLKRIMWARHPVSERNSKIVRLRDSGQSFAEIGRRFKISTARVSHVYYRTKRRVSEEEVVARFFAEHPEHERETRK